MRVSLNHLPALFTCHLVANFFGQHDLEGGQMTVLAVVTLLPAPSPKAVLPWPVLFKASAPKPMAVLPLPVVLSARAH